MGYDNNSKPIYKLNSPDIKWLPGKNYCGNHPHNFYIQLFAETGIIGLILGSLMFFYIIKTCYDEKLSNPNCILTSICYIIPLAFSFHYNKLEVFLVNGTIYLYGFQLDFAFHKFKIINQFSENKLSRLLSKIDEIFFASNVKLFQDFF